LGVILNPTRLAVFAVCLAFMPAAFAAVPASFERPGVAPLESVRLVELPPLDRAVLLEEDALAALEPEKVLRVAVPRKVGIEMAAMASFDGPGDAAIWRVRVRAAGALWVAPGFGTFRPQPGARVWLYTPDREVLAGPFTDADVRAHGQLWVPPLPGDTVVVEIDWAGAPPGARPNVHLGEILHGYKSIPGSDLGGGGGGIGGGGITPSAGACNIDVNCPLGADWQDEKRGVVNLLNSGGGFCSGSLITNTGADCRNYVLTAAHCLSSQSSASGTIFQFNFERPGCGTGIAPTSQQLTGSFLRATFSSSDFTLLEMDDPIPEAWNPYYNGWSRDTAASLGSHCIHHPNNDEKKISYNDDLLLAGQNWGPDHWRVDNWEQGTTEPGSSGSPLFDADSRIVGQLHGGTASCSSITYDEFGKVDVSWNGGGTAASRLRDWLDPDSTGAVTADGLDAATCRIPQPRLAYRGTVVDDSQGNGNGIAEPGETLVLEIDTDNAGTLDATSVNGVLSSPAPLATVLDPSADWPSIPQAAFRRSLAPHFTVSLDAGWVCGEPVPLSLDYSAAEGPGAWTSNFEVSTGTANVSTTFQDQMESGLNGWTGQALEGTLSWLQTTADSFSPTHSWFVQDISTRADTVLLMPSLANLPARSVLRFRHRYNSEANYDGGVLEYTTNGGSTWVDAGSLVTEGAYTGSIRSTASSNLAGRSAWAGDSAGWSAVSVDLASLAGATVRFRWRFATDTSVSDEGWFVDDVVVDSTTYTCEASLQKPGEASGQGGGALEISKDPGGYLLTWSAPQTGGTPTSYRLYRTVLAAPLAPECEADLGAATSSVLAALTADRGFLVVARNGAGEGDYGTDGAGTPRPPAAIPCP
jgi:hypothetical protein